jgi:hypothetical protein
MNEIKECKDSKTLWKKLRTVGVPGKSTKSANIIGLATDKNEISFDPEYVVNSFNSFFCNVASQLVKDLPTTEHDITSVGQFYNNMGDQNNPPLTLNAVSVEKVQKALAGISIAKATGSDNIPGHFLKDAAPIIAKPFAHIVNQSIETSSVPEAFKIAKVVPLFKKGSKTTESNYRPISILPVASKIMERLIHDQLYEYLSKYNLLYKYQSGFRSGFSTDTALTYLADTIRRNIDDRLYTGAVLIDLQKAFDTVNHAILIAKMKAMGLGDPIVSWIHSYLSNRQQYVELNGVKSRLDKISCGVPQGSILGPLLFSIYVNDMVQSVNCDLLLYADDSVLIKTGNDPKTIEENLSTELNSLRQWLIQNKLSIHLGKTESILFASRSNLCKCKEMSVKCNGICIKASTSVKYLGVMLNNDMTCKDMGNAVIAKINKKLKFLYRKREYFDFKARKLICSTLIQPDFDYAINAWYRGTTFAIKNRLQICQNKIIRYINSYDNRHHISASDFEKLKWLNVENRVNNIALNLMFKIHNNLAPSYLCNMTPTSHPYATRGSILSYEQNRVGSKGMQTFQYNGVKLWNNLPVDIKSITTIDSFKHKIKAMLMNNQHANH